MSATAYSGTEQRRPRVLIVDDDADVRTLLRTRFEISDEMDVVGEAGDGREAIELVRSLDPDLVVIDLDMPQMRGDEAIPLLRRMSPRLRIVMYSGTVGAPTALYGPGAAPDGLVEKGRPLKELEREVRSVMASPTAFDPIG